MNNQHDLYSRLESVDPLASEPVPAGWSRRKWVQREVVAFAAAAADSLLPKQGEPAAE